MKISSEQYPILNFLRNRRRFPMAISPAINNTAGIAEDLLSELSEDAPVQYLSKAFIKAFYSSMQRIQETTTLWRTSPRDSHGIILFDGSFIAYNVLQGEVGLCIGAGNQINNIIGVNINHEQIFGYVTNDTTFSNDYIINYWAAFVLLLLFFINNCPIEAKVLPPKSQATIKLTGYLNQSDTQVQIINCTWFTTLISNIPHGVRGHFRWQPCGKGRAQVKLIWIEGFQRQGFVKRARVLKSNPLHPENEK